MIELLVVIAIIGVMAAGLMYIIDPLGQIQKANDAKRKSDLEQLQRTLEVYYNDNGSYPPHNTGAVTGCASPYRINPSTGCQEWDSTWTAYNTKLPEDPTSSTRNYVYYAGSSGQSYYLYASLEKTNDPQLCFPSTGAICTNVPADATCSSSSTCNYGVSSPNVSP